MNKFNKNTENCLCFDIIEECPPPTNHHQNVHVLLPRPWACITIHTKGTMQVWSGTFRWRDGSGLSGQGWCNHKGAYEGKRETGQPVSVMRCEKDWTSPAGFEDGRRSWAKEGRQLLETRKGKETDSLPEPPERNTAPLIILTKTFYISFRIKDGLFHLE